MDDNLTQNPIYCRYLVVIRRILFNLIGYRVGTGANLNN